MTPTATLGKPGVKIVTHAEWLAARTQFLAKEKEFTRLRDELSRQRRELPWEKVESSYVFEGPRGKLTLADLFAGRSQLLIYHFMFGPGWKEGCPSCSYLSDSFDGARLHMAQRDTTLAVVSRATITEIEAFRKRMGWQFPWVSSFGTDFNHDFQVSASKEDIESGKAVYNYMPSKFPSEELPGISIFIRHEGGIYHSYSTYARGLDILVPTYNLLDLTPKGRDEANLPWPMAWVRHHDRYGNPEAMEAISLLAQASGKPCCSEQKE